jgi:hypothetical protein
LSIETIAVEIMTMHVAADVGVIAGPPGEVVLLLRA